MLGDADGKPLLYDNAYARLYIFVNKLG